MFYSQLFENNKTTRKLEKIQNVIGAYSLAKDIYAMINEPFFFSENDDVIKFFDKYEELENIEDMKIEDFPIEKLFIEIYSLYEGIKNNKIKININISKLPVEIANIDSFTPEEIEDIIKDAFIKCYESEIKKSDFKNKKLKKLKYDLIVNNLKEKMENHVKKEEYEEAAIIRDEIKELEN